MTLREKTRLEKFRQLLSILNTDLGKTYTKNLEGIFCKLTFSLNRSLYRITLFKEVICGLYFLSSVVY